MEIIGIVADETENQRRTLPHAVRRVSYRVIFYYVASFLVLSLNVSIDDPLLFKIISGDSLLSPFALMMERAGLPLTHFVYAAALIASVSVANTRLYICVMFILLTR